MAEVTAAAAADVQTVAAQAQSPTEIRAALFAAVPLVVGDYSDAAASLALDWYEELRDASQPTRLFTPVPVMTVDEDRLAAMIAWATGSLHDLEKSLTRTLDAEAEKLVAQATEESLALLLPEIQKDVAAGFRSTMVTNSDEDPDAVGWQRFARAGGCKFCKMLADRGAVYTEASVRFAAHTDCHCVVGPSFDPDAPRADVMQYVASRKTRTPEQRAALRDYLNEHFSDAPG